MDLTRFPGLGKLAGRSVANSDSNWLERVGARFVRCDSGLMVGFESPSLTDTVKY